MLASEPVLRIGVFRALVLGDLLCATPALRAIKACWPGAELTLIGLPWARAIAERLATVDRFESFPGCAGLPEIEPDIAARPAFDDRTRSARFDLLFQLQGSGSIVNSMLATWGARHVAGFVEPGEFCADPALHTRWPGTGHEIFRLLRLVDHLGIARRGDHMDFAVTDADRARLCATVPELRPGEQLVCIHPGAQLPSRRWLPARFAAVADSLADSGLRVVLTGTQAEAELTAQVSAEMHRPALDLAGRTDLFTLGALLEQARLVVCNDTGISHVAAALHIPSVVVSSGSDVARWAPLNRALHRVVWRDVPCRPCAYRECPHGHECARAVGIEEVVALALRASSTTRSGARSARALPAGS